jgi:hypothetical protein
MDGWMDGEITDGQMNRKKDKENQEKTSTSKIF